MRQFGGLKELPKRLMCSALAGGLGLSHLTQCTDTLPPAPFCLPPTPPWSLKRLLSMTRLPGCRPGAHCRNLASGTQEVAAASHSLSREPLDVGFGL